MILCVKIYSTLRFGGRAVDPSLHEKEHICRHASIFVRNFSIFMSFGFLFFQAPGLRRSSFRWVKAETSLWPLCWSVSWVFRVATRFLGFRFSTSLTHCESYRARKRWKPLEQQKVHGDSNGFEVKNIFGWLDGWKKIEKNNPRVYDSKGLNFKLCAYLVFSGPFYPDCLFQIHPMYGREIERGRAGFILDRSHPYLGGKVKIVHSQHVSLSCLRLQRYHT